MTFTEGILKRFNEADKKAFAVQAAGMVLAICFFTYLYVVAIQMKLNDPDFWWHLKTGDYVLEHMSVPEVDPFSYTTPRPLSTSKKIGLRAQWLGQVILYSVHNAWGLKGNVMFRNFLIVMPMFLLMIWLTVRKVPAWHALIYISMPALMLDFQLFYSFERPQGFSFNLVILACILLDRIRRVAPKKRFDFSYVLLPAFMAFWSNVHGGYIVGNYIIMIYLISEALMFGWRRFIKKEKVEVPVRLFVICIAAILCTSFNPNGLATYIRYTKGLLGMFIRDATYYAGGGGGSGWVRTVVLEFKPLTYFYSYLHYDWLILYWLFSALTFITMITRFILKREFDLAELMTISFVIVFANMYARGLMFSLTVLPFYFAKNVIELEVPKKAFRVAMKAAMVGALALTVGFVSYTYKHTPKVFKPKFPKAGWVSPWYPSHMVGFIKKYKPKPPMYNYYTWGGYLIWTLYPEYQVFIDGRALSSMMNQAADQILKSFPGWQQKLDVYNINFIAIPVIFRESGHAIPLAKALVKEPGWKLVFIGQNAAVFVRDHPRNSELIKRFNRDKRYVYSEIIKLENVLMRGMPWNPVFNVTKADALFDLGKYAEAKKIYEQFPKASAQQLRKLRNMGY
jgi:hypothetical protein